MLNIIICDDRIEMVNNIKKIIEGKIFIDEIDDITIELATTNPYEVLDLFRMEKKFADGEVVVTAQPLKQRLLFLDINFGADFSKIDGVKLASDIRKFDISSNIVFVTSSGEERADVLDQKIVALGYLKKSLDEQAFKMRILDLMQTARVRMSMATPHRKMIEFKTGHVKR